MHFFFFARYLRLIINPDFPIEKKTIKDIKKVSCHGSRARFPSRVKLNFWRQMLANSPSTFTHPGRLKGYPTSRLPNWGAWHCEENELAAFWSSAVSFFNMALICFLCHTEDQQLLSFFLFFIFIACSDWSVVFSSWHVGKSMQRVTSWLLESIPRSRPIRIILAFGMDDRFLQQGRWVYWSAGALYNRPLHAVPLCHF